MVRTRRTVKNANAANFDKEDDIYPVTKVVQNLNDIPCILLSYNVLKFEDTT